MVTRVRRLKWVTQCALRYNEPCIINHAFGSITNENCAGRAKALCKEVFYWHSERSRWSRIYERSQMVLAREVSASMKDIKGENWFVFVVVPSVCVCVCDCGLSYVLLSVRLWTELRPQTQLPTPPSPLFTNSCRFVILCRIWFRWEIFNNFDNQMQ